MPSYTYSSEMQQKIWVIDRNRTIVDFFKYLNVRPIKFEYYSRIESSLENFNSQIVKYDYYFY